MTGPAYLPLVLLRGRDGASRHVRLEDVTAAEIAAGNPVRRIVGRKGAPNIPGDYWSEKDGRHLPFESQLELSRLLLGEHDPDVTAMLTQPFVFLRPDGGRAATPDILLVRRGGGATVVDVVRRDALTRPRLRERARQVGAALRARGWDHEVWTGADPLVVSNVRFLSGYRWADRIDPASLAVARGATGAPTTFRLALAAAAPGDVPLLRPALLHLLWNGERACDLTKVLCGDTEMWPR
ncbi:hypothetical protein EV189_0363 [Motilibacter rhizosphaerae]|uniref:TnsA endonuclease-like protein n=1 Tax=Motilibacter rhizosphaerae TaxID=598652 RepID=A0A4Q7NVW0_9ACTN|nr:TnsA-like heteromeric transposase endonuclease subunit [Motilibacter rhizosphaerae]RZS91130.1 hypothetical protein EV189_0363 [Motilibacter rhizosphaerae]